MKTYLELNHEKLAIQLGNFASKIPLYADVFGFTAEEVSAIQNDAAYFGWVVNSFKKMATYKKHWTAYKTELLSNKISSNNTLTPIIPALETAPAEVSTGIVPRFTTMVNRIKAHPNYNSGIGQNLGVVYTPPAKWDAENAKPILKAVIRAGIVNLDWKKGSYDGILIEKDSGNGFVVLDKSLRPNYRDKSIMPPLGSSAVWKYRAMYLAGDEQLGQWSDIVTLSVMG